MWLFNILAPCISSPILVFTLFTYKWQETTVAFLEYILGGCPVNPAQEWVGKLSWQDPGQSQQEAGPQSQTSCWSGSHGSGTDKSWGVKVLTTLKLQNILWSVGAKTTIHCVPHPWVPADGMFGFGFGIEIIHAQELGVLCSLKHLKEQLAEFLR